jgi:hypothetical protein
MPNILECKHESGSINGTINILKISHKGLNVDPKKSYIFTKLQNEYLLSE